MTKPVKRPTFDTWGNARQFIEFNRRSASWALGRVAAFGWWYFPFVDGGVSIDPVAYRNWAAQA